MKPYDRKSVHKRSHDFPDINDYTFEELREVCKVYEELRRSKNEVTSTDIMDHFKCSEQKARVMLSAAEFHAKMKKKGLV
jgi:hypothetical protein